MTTAVFPAAAAAVQHDLAVTDFDQLYKTYAADVFRFAMYLSGDRADAEDITSETFVRAWTAPGPIAMSTVKGYLLTIARNLFLQGVRKQSRAVPLDESIRDSHPAPDAEAQGRADYRAVMDAMQRLPEIDRSALLMSAYEGMSYEEIARALGISLPAVKMKIHRSRLKLTEVIQ